MEQHYPGSRYHFFAKTLYRSYSKNSLFLYLRAGRGHARLPVGPVGAEDEPKCDAVGGYEERLTRVLKC